ncbi:hypothetical protein E2E30_08875 [Sphingomonas sp. AAP5]|uniref:hypothetical protein n=1 Tax=Sphingomonas sp. AAP5 TaxID=1523415 RepID=UPI001056FC51|nr:hypothetical protein [Sphingomonas sp. AAP5]QBM75875.1 hypothetical protein E2E30_08875 [Sphingomonas sp. AAP5]
MSGVFHASATTARLDTAMEQAPPHLYPVLLAVRDHRVGMLFVGQDAGSFAIPKESTRPAIVLIGDDLEQSVGPDGFHMPSLRRLVRKCSAFTVVSSAPTAEIYAAGTAPAVGGKNAVIIETRLAHEFQWVALIQKLAPGRPILLSTVKGGHA